MKKHIENSPVQHTGQTLTHAKHNFICIVYETALQAGFEADYGPNPNGEGFFVEVHHCNAKELDAIIQFAIFKAAA